MTTRYAAGLLCALALALAGAPAPARADPWKDESGPGRRGGGWEDRERGDRHDDWRRGRDEERRRGGRGGEERYTYDDGECRVEVKRERNGEVREERRCRGQARHGYGPPPDPYHEAPPPPPFGYAPSPAPLLAPGGRRGGWIEPDGG